MVDLSKLNFFSGVNYMKRHLPACGYFDINPGAFGTATRTVAHGLGYIPDFLVQGDLDGASLWSNNIPYAGMSGSGGTPNGYEVTAWIDENTLTIQVNNNTASSGARRVWYKVYKDYA